MLHVCRLCLRGGCALYNIVDAGLQDTFETVTRVLLDEADGYPQDVCRICCTQLKKCKKLIEMSYKSELLLRDMAKHQFSSETIEEISGMSVTLCTLVTSETSVVSFDSDPYRDVSVKKECNESDTEYGVLEGASIKEENDSQLSIKAEDESNPETQLDTGTEDYEERKSDDTQNVGATNCYNNTFIINPRSSILINMPQGADSHFICDYCNKSFKVKIMLKQHIVSTHMIKTVNNTLSNNIDAATAAEYQESADKQEDDECGLFGNLFHGETERHNIHELELKKSNIWNKSLRCKICGKTFTCKSKLETHMRIHTGNKPFKCDVCDKGFKNKSHLLEHMKVHTGEKPFKCNECEKRFGHNSSLNVHMRIHTGNKPYRCDVCHKRFTLKCNLTKHMRVHTGEKPYRCGVCFMRFTQKSALNTHIPIHIGEKPFRCDVCSKRFRIKSYLDSHMRVHTGEKPYGCNMCLKRFSLKSSLKKHMLIHVEKVSIYDAPVTKSWYTTGHDRPLRTYTRKKAVFHSSLVNDTRECR